MLNSDRDKALKYFCNLSKELSNTKVENNTSLNKTFVHKTNPQNVLINDIIKIKDSEGEFDEKIGLYYSVATPNFQCSFIFDHPLDHYSFMLMLELARQVSIGVTHKYNHFSVESIKNTVNNIDLKIHNFAELDCPMLIGCTDEIRKNKPTMQIRDLNFFFVQNGKLCAEIKSAISVMSSQLYNRFRINNRRNTLGIDDVNLITNLDIIEKNKYSFYEKEQTNNSNL